MELLTILRDEYRNKLGVKMKVKCYVCGKEETFRTREKAFNAGWGAYIVPQTTDGWINICEVRELQHGLVVQILFST